jgi:hypothetical protein
MMPNDHLIESSAAPLPVSRWTVAAFALVLTAADGFLATALRGATGYIQNTQEPFRDWVLYLAVMLPIVAGTVLGALWLARRFVRQGAMRMLVGAALVVVLTTTVAMAQMGLTAVYDYRSQVAQQTLMHHIHDGNGTTIRLDPGVSVPAQTPSCTGLCAQKQGTLDAHMRGLRLGLLLLLITNGVLVLWALALRGGRIWIRRGQPAANADATDPLAVL